MGTTAQQSRMLDIIVKVLGKDARVFSEAMEVKLAEGLQADSLDAVDLVMTLEEEFSIDISDDELDSIAEPESGATVGDLWKLIEGKLAADAAEPAATVETIEEAVRDGLVPGLTPEMLDAARAERVGGEG